MSMTRTPFGDGGNATMNFTAANFDLFMDENAAVRGWLINCFSLFPKMTQFQFRKLCSKTFDQL